MATTGFGKALKRLEKDRQELLESPVPNVSGAPLESNMLEWHCNIKFRSNIYHVLLFFSKEYPCVSPRAEIVPSGFSTVGMAVSRGEKGESLCLDIFSGFADQHPEWEVTNDSGWSPSYTVQTLLLNLLSFLYQISEDEDEDEDDLGLRFFLEANQTFECPDCGHSQKAPYPPLLESESEIKEDTSNLSDFKKEDSETAPNDNISVSPVDQEDNRLEILAAKIIDYVSKETFSTISPSSQKQVFGYGIVLSDLENDCCPISPCEFLTASSFQEMCETSFYGKASSISREELSYFLPLYITAEHSLKIKPLFEKTMASLAKRYRSKISFIDTYVQATINVMAHIMSRLVGVCIITTTLDRAHRILESYLQLHRLLLWVLEMYPKARKCVNKRLDDFLSNPSLLNKRPADGFEFCFTLLSVSDAHSWETVSDVYIKEHWRRAAKYYLLSDPSLGSMDISMDYRLQKTFELTKGYCSREAIQLAFLRLVKPSGLTENQILQRYEDNLCLPTQEMTSEMREAFRKINENINSFEEWFQFMGLPVPSKDDFHDTLKRSVKYCKARRAYQYRNRSLSQHRSTCSKCSIS